MWGVTLALQSSGAVHLGVDNLSVVRQVGRLLDGRHCPTLFELVKDGDLLFVNGTNASSEGSEHCVVKRFLVGSVGLLVMVAIFFGNVLFLLLLRFVKILSFTIS